MKTSETFLIIIFMYTEYFSIHLGNLLNIVPIIPYAGKFSKYFVLFCSRKFS